MTIASTSSKTVGRGNGATTAFTYQFLIPDAESLLVTYVSALGVETSLAPTQYSVSGLGNDAGGTVTYPLSGSPIATGASIVIERVLDITQTTRIINQGGYYPRVVEAALDKLTMLIQQLADGARNYPLALTFPAVDVDPDTVLPPAAARAGLFFAFDGSGNPTLLPGTSFGGDLSPYTTIATGSGTARSLGARALDVVSVKDFGAVGNGSSNDTTAIQTALNSGAKAIHFPYGTYSVGAISVPSNVRLYGDGRSSSVLKLRSNINAPVLAIGTSTDVTIEDIGIDGNYLNQSGGDGSGITCAGGSKILLRNVRVQDVQDWGFGFYDCSDVVFDTCDVPTIKGGVNAAAVRAGFLTGSSAGATNGVNVAFTNCFAGGSNPFTDGFIAERGSDVRVTGCRTAVSYAGFKIKTDRTTVQGCYATGGVAGFQTQSGQRYVNFVGNHAYRCGDSGFFFTNLDTVNPFYGLSVIGNMATECGQAPLSTSYGFAFETVAACTLSDVTIVGNVAVDHQGVPTQARGISFGTSGTVSNVVLANNLCKGNTVDIHFGASLQLATLTRGFNPGNTGGDNAYPMQVASLHFWIDNLPQASGTLLMNDGLGGRGYVVPRAGYIRALTGKSNAPITAGNATFQLRVNGVINGAFNTQLNVAAPSVTATTVAIQSQVVAAGDMITCVVTGDGALLPNGSADMDVIIEVIY